MEDTNYLVSAFKEIGISLTDIQIKQFTRYYDFLIEQNKVMNLTTITEYNEVVIKHFVDSLSLIRVIDLNKTSKVIDIGTGAGFPGIPLKIVFPHLDIILLDSLNKRLKFLNDVILKLGFNEDSIRTIHGRAEDFGQNKLYREEFDLCVSRAVANLSTLAEFCIPFVKKGGSFISYKAGDVEEEVEQSRKAVKVLGGEVKLVDSFRLPSTDIDRSLVRIDKVKVSPKRFPRQAGKPKREPIE